MVRFPRGWGQAFHPQAVRRGSPLAYRPGWQGSGMQPMTATPIRAYTGKVTSIPLTGGQAQGQITPGYPGGSGSVTSPSAFQTIVTVSIPGPGTYTVNWTVTLSGTLSAGDANNFQLYHYVASTASSTFIAASVNAATAGSYPQSGVSVTVAAGDFLTVTAAGTTPTSGAVYAASLPAPAAARPLSLTIAPQGLGTVWYPVQITLSTTTGALDTSVALVYLGPLTTPATLVGTVYSGNGTVALAIPSMTPGQSLITTWTGGNPGDTAAVNVIGTMDALTTS